MDFKTTRKCSDFHEKRVAKNLGGLVVSGSGSGKFSKGDVHTEDWIIECKNSMLPKETMTIHKEWFVKNEEYRAQMLKSYAAVCFSFGDGKNYYAMDEKTFKFLLAISRGEL